MAAPAYTQVITGGGTGVSTPFGIFLPPAANVAAYVRSTGIQSGDDAWTSGRLYTTLAGGIAQCRAGFGDTVIVLPGHAENVTDATMLSSLVAGTKIIGIGEGPLRPKFTWTAAASQWSFGAANCLVENCRLDLSGYNGVTLGITFTTTGTTIRGCEIITSTSAALLCTTGITIPTAGSYTRIIGNNIHGVVAGSCTDVMNITGTPSGVEVRNNEIIACAADGHLFGITGAALECRITDNLFYNVTASCDFSVTLASAAMTGFYARNAHFSAKAGTVASQGISVGANSVLGIVDSKGANVLATQAALQPAADT